MRVRIERRFVSLVLAMCLLATVFVGNALADDVAEPVFSCEGGVYAEEFVLTIDGNGANVYYTLDGSEPDGLSNLYTGGIEIRDLQKSPRTIQGKIAQERMEYATVVKAVCIDDFGNRSDVVTNTYFVSEAVNEIAENVPVIAISTEPENLWDSKKGIYTNYNEEMNVSAYIEYFDNNGEGFERGIEMKLGGHYSKVNAKKSLRIYFTKGDANGAKNLQYDLIEGTDRNFYDSSAVKKYGKITLRISDWDTTDLRDVVAQKVTEYMRPESANSNPAAVFLNGEFWGIYECREQYDNRYLDYHYEGIDKDEVVYVDRDWTNETEMSVLSDNGEEMPDRVTYEEGPDEDEEYYLDLFNYTKYLMMHADEGNNYAEVSAYIDIDNFIDYLFIYLYLDNIDWPGNNYKTWRTTIERSNGDVYGADGKWRFMVHDFDIAFSNSRNNTLEYAITSRMPNDDARQPSFAAETLDGMFKVQKFRDKFAQRAAAYMATAVSSENMTEAINLLVEERESVKAYDLLRWNNMHGTTQERLDEWKVRVESTFIEFFKTREEVFGDMLAEFCQKHYDSTISEQTSFTFEIDADRASVDIDGAVIRKSLYGESAASFTTMQYTAIPLTISAEVNDGYKVKSIEIETDGVKTVYEQESVTITPEKKDYKVTINIEEGEEAESVMYADDIFVLREGRFLLMKVGEKLPVEIATTGGEKLFGAECYVNGTGVVLGDNNIVTAVEAGEGTIVVSYGGYTKEVLYKVQ
ncbi:MAG: CotH kinase family protein [Clostridia bacterium]|nr:CotH kinase family protein [Clostridia bacterium]